jgi:hypothetical protein
MITAKIGRRSSALRGPWLFLAFWLLLPALPVRASSTNSVVDVLIVVGAGGEKEYEEAFSEAVKDWENACRTAHKTHRVIPAIGTNQVVEVRDAIGAQFKGDSELWIILVGHGTFDGKEAKFNLNGPDISAKEMGTLLSQAERPLILINTASSSAPFINELSHSNRVVVTATKSGWEENYTRYGKFFARSIADLASDLDKDGQVSLLEAFLTASRQVEEFYNNEKRLSTEHALLDDNGDGKGTPSTFFRGIRPAKKPEGAANVDGFRAHQIQFRLNETEARLSPALRKRRNQLELELERVRARKEQLDEDSYLKEIEPILLELSRLYHTAEKPKSE